MRNMLGILTAGVLEMACAAILFAMPQQKSGASAPSATKQASSASAKKKTTKPAAPKAATGCPKSNDVTITAVSNPDLIELGALTGSDADALAKTLSSIFRGQYIVTLCGASKSDSGAASDPASDTSSSDSSSGSKPTLLRVQRVGSAEVPVCPADASRCTLDALARNFDRDNFSGAVLNSNFVINVPDRDFAKRLAEDFPHPLPDIDIEQVNGGTYLVLVPSSFAVKQSTAAKTLGQDAACLKQDLDRLSKRYSASLNEPLKVDIEQPKCFPDPVLPADTNETINKKTIDAERCFAEYTIMLSALDPRDVALQLETLFDNRVAINPQVFPLNHSIVLLPAKSKPNANKEASAIEQFELYQEEQKQAKLSAMLQTSSGEGKSANTTPMTTTVTSKTKASVPGPSGKGSPATTTSTSTTTSTTSQGGGQASGGGASAGGGGAQTSGASGSSGGGGSSGSGSGGGGGSAGGQGSGGPAQPSQPSWSIDNIVRLYHYRDAAGIAAAINGMISYAPNSRPIVEPLSDFGVNDVVQILPSAAAQGGYSIGDIERAITLLDLPRPQLSLQVWSYQISAKVENPTKTYKGGEADAARCVLENVNRRVDEVNRKMTKALQAAMDAVFTEVRSKRNEKEKGNSFFDEDFREYLTKKYSECIDKDHYCLGYFTALDYPAGDTEGYLAGASLGRLLLFLAAAKQPETSAQNKPLVTIIIEAMRAQVGGRCPCDRCTQEKCRNKPSKCEETNPKCKHDPKPVHYFSRLEDQLNHISHAGNLNILRTAFLDFFFNYKWTLNYPNDFVPYDLRRSAHVLDDLLQPINNAFNQDIDEYVQDNLDDPNLICKTDKAGLISQGMVSVAALSGTQAFVSGQIANYFNITQTPSLSEVAQSLLATSGSGGSSGGGSGGGTGGGSGGGGSGSGGGGGSQSSGTGGGGSGKGSGGTGSGGNSVSALQGLISSNPYVVGGEALASILAPQRVTAELTKGVSLTVTPTSLDTASGAQLTVNLVVNEPDGGPQSVSSAATKKDLLDRVATHQVTDVVRVESLKLFDLSTLSMEITHPQPPTCVPLAEGDWRVVSYIAAVPFSVPCAVWRSVFGSMPMAGRLFQWPRSPITVDNRSVAIIRAVVVPTAMDFGEALTFEDDRIADPITNSTTALSSARQIGWRPRQFHKLMLQCIGNPSTSGCPATLSTVQEDVRKPTTN